jgi:DNA-binding XRE family transcriptional regulator
VSKGQQLDGPGRSTSEHGDANATQILTVPYSKFYMIGVAEAGRARRRTALTTDVPALVRGIRAARNITQEQLAREIGVTFSTINAWENGRHRPIPALVNRLLDIASAVGVAAAARRSTQAPRPRRRGRLPGK